MCVLCIDHVASIYSVLSWIAHHPKLKYWSAVRVYHLVYERHGCPLLLMWLLAVMVTSCFNLPSLVTHWSKRTGKGMLILDVLLYTL